MKKDLPTLSCVTEFIVDCLHKTAPIQETGYPLIRTPNIGKGRFNLDGVYRISQETYDKWTIRAVPQKNDLIMAREAPAGNVAIIKSEEPHCLGQRTVHIRPNPDLIDPDFLTYFLLAPKQQAALLKNQIGVHVGHVNMKDIRKLPLENLPPMEEQKRRAEIIASYDDLIENNKRRIELLEESARQLYKEWFVRFRFPGHEHVKIIDGVPEGWRKRPLNDLLEIKHGFAFKGEFFSDDPTSLILMTPGNFKIGGGIKLDKKKYYSEDTPVPEDYVLEENELLVTMTDLSKTSDTLGFPALVPKQNGQIFLHNQRLGKVSSRQDFYFPKYYFYHVFLDTKYRAFVVGSASGTSVKHTSPKKILSHEHLMPNEISDSLIEQFNEFTKGLYNQINTLISWNENLVKARDLLLPKLMSGEIAV